MFKRLLFKFLSFKLTIKCNISKKITYYDWWMDAEMPYISQKTFKD